MLNPFPGMNPYLEQPGLWHQVHNRLIIAMADDLTMQIVPQYFVSIEERIYTSTEDSGLLLGIADVAVGSNNSDASRVATLPTTMPQVVHLPIPEMITERYLEVRSTDPQELITVIEILSPKNKRSGEGRVAYERNRQAILASRTHLVEIDLLRQGNPFPLGGSLHSDYRILISREAQRPKADLYGFNLRDRIPNIPIPLCSGNPEPMIDLQRLLNEVYTRARFDIRIDLSLPIRPPLSEDDRAWVESFLTEGQSHG